MCFPPFCEPAHHFLGCLSIRNGAATVLVINCLYGLCLVVTHALLIGQEEAIETTSPSPQSGLQTQQMPAMQGAVRLNDHHWFLQLVDVDLAWGHSLLGFDDYSCLVAGLLYGLLIVGLSGFMFHAVHYGGRTLPLTARWFVAFLNLELVLYVALVFAKLPKLCSPHYMDLHWPALQMDCHVLRFMYIQRAFVFLIVGGFCCWIFSSLAYFLSFGNAAMDKPEFADMLAQHEANMANQPPGVLPGQRQSGAARSILPTASIARGQATADLFMRPGDSIVPGSAGLGGGSVLPGSSLNRAVPQGSYRFPRASSSMQTTTSENGSQAEMQSLIKPPVAIY